MVSPRNKLFAFLILIAFIGYAQNTDLNVLKSINAKSYPAWDKAMNITSASLYAIMPISFVGTLSHGYFSHDEKILRNGFRSGASLLIAGGITSTLKLLVNRNRPYIDHPHSIIQRDKNVGPHSFPSGHSTFAFATATNLSLTYKKWYITVPAYAYASLVGYARMRLGVHYPSDVLAGAIIGIGSGFLVWKLDEGWLAKRKKKTDLKTQ